MEGHQFYHPSLVWSQGEPRLIDAYRGVKLEVNNLMGRAIHRCSLIG